MSSLQLTRGWPIRYRKLTADGDYSFGSGQLDFYRDVPEAVAQAAKTRLLLWVGEWFLDITEGTQYMLGILGKHSKTTADNTIQDRVQKTEGVVNIESYTSEVNPETRKIAASMVLNTIYGPTKAEIENYSNY